MGAIRETKKPHEFAPGVMVRSFESDLYTFEISWFDGNMGNFKVWPRKNLYHSINCSKTGEGYEYYLDYNMSFNYVEKDRFKENLERTIKFMEEEFIPFINNLEPPEQAK